MRFRYPVDATALTAAAEDAGSSDSKILSAIRAVGAMFSDRDRALEDFLNTALATPAAGSFPIGPDDDGTSTAEISHNVTGLGDGQMLFDIFDDATSAQVQLQMNTDSGNAASTTLTNDTSDTTTLSVGTQATNGAGGQARWVATAQSRNGDLAIIDVRSTNVGAIPNSILIQAPNTRVGHSTLAMLDIPGDGTAYLLAKGGEVVVSSFGGAVQDARLDAGSGTAYCRAQKSGSAASAQMVLNAGLIVEVDTGQFTQQTFHVGKSTSGWATIFETLITQAPDADLTTSDFTMWLDDTPGATKLMFKAKDSGGTVRTGSVALV